jgi:hypothetical protein
VTGFSAKFRRLGKNLSHCYVCKSDILGFFGQKLNNLKHYLLVGKFMSMFIGLNLFWDFGLFDFSKTHLEPILQIFNLQLQRQRCGGLEHFFQSRR